MKITLKKTKVVAFMGIYPTGYTNVTDSVVLEMVSCYNYQGYGTDMTIKINLCFISSLWQNFKNIKEEALVRKCRSDFTMLWLSPLTSVWLECWVPRRGLPTAEMYSFKL